MLGIITPNASAFNKREFLESKPYPSAAKNGLSLQLLSCRTLFLDGPVYLGLSGEGAIERARAISVADAAITRLRSTSTLQQHTMIKDQILTIVGRGLGRAALLGCGQPLAAGSNSRQGAEPRGCRRSETTVGVAGVAAHAGVGDATRGGGAGGVAGAASNRSKRNGARARRRLVVGLPLEWQRAWAGTGGVAPEAKLAEAGAEEDEGVRCLQILVAATLLCLRRCLISALLLFLLSATLLRLLVTPLMGTV